MAWVRTTALALGAAAVAGGATAQQQKVTGPVSTYWMSADTLSGFGAAMAGGANGQRPGMGAMMGAMMGGGSNVSKTLRLDLGTSRKAAGEPSAEHVPPANLRAGGALPLVTPQGVSKPEEEPRLPPEYRKPKGKLLIFWGCGERARPGQPVVLDFAQMADGKIPANMPNLQGLPHTAMTPPSPSRNTTYGGWPNPRTRINVPASGSLLGDHLIHGNYTNDIKFSLVPGQDFLGALNLTRNEVTPSGSGAIAWNNLMGAKAYLALAVGAGDKDTIVLWSSSEAQGGGFAMPDYLSPGDITRLVASKGLMPATQTACAIPQEVVKAAPQAMVQLAAYGGEANFSYPPRPADPKVPWNIDWQVKVRYKAQTGGMLGMDMGAMMRGEDSPGPRNAGGPPGRRPPPQQQPPSVGGAIMRGVLGGKIPGL